MRHVAVAIMVGGALASGIACAQAPVNVFSAGSLRAPLTEIGRQYEAQTNTKIIFTFGASGLLKERIVKGEAADVFTSANTEHPEALAKLGLAHPPRVFTRNQMCALLGPGLSVGPEGLLEAMLRPDLKLGTSTPNADPSGDYAWTVFENAERIRPGAYRQLDAKALKLTGGADSPPPPAERNVYGDLVANGRADIFLTYCTNVRLAIAEQPRLKQTALPAELAVGADYGLAVLKSAGPAGQMFADHLLGADARRVFAKYGFTAPPAMQVAGATTPALLSVELPGKPAVKFSRGDLEKLERKTAAVAVQDKGPFQYSGVTLFSILQAAGYSLDQPRRGANLTQYVLLIAADGYRAVYAMGDFDPKSKRAAPLLVWQQDGAPLKESERPYRLIIPDNVHTSRWIRQVERIIVRQVDE
jgi:molybdate transport system substrate-binding protein